MTERVVVLLDMDCFYCQVEAQEDPTLQGVPSAVVQHNDWRGGGIIAVNYEARAFGVSRNMRGEDAKEKCPEIRLVRVPMIREKADLTKYREAGRKVLSTITQFHPQFIVERASVDEAYLDITSVVETLDDEVEASNLPNTWVVGYQQNEVHQWLKQLNSDDRRLAIGAQVMEEVRQVVFEKTGYRCSAGIAHNKILAKISCGLHKPNQQTILPHSSVPILYNTLKLTKLRGLGGKFGDQILEVLNIQTAKELSMIPLKVLQNHFDDKTGLWLYRLGQGLDDEPVKERDLPKSIGCSKNFRGSKNQLDTLEKVNRWLKLLADELSDRLIKDKESYSRTAKSINVHVGFAGHQRSVSRGGQLSSYDSDGIAQRAFQLIQKLNSSSDTSCWKPPITLLSLNASKFEENNGSATSSIVSFLSSKKDEQTPSINSDEVVSTSSHDTNEQDIQLNENANTSASEADYANVDPSVLEFLPPDIKLEIESEIKRRKAEIENENCPKCGIGVSPFDLQEHLDFHLAKELQKDFQNTIPPPVAKRKSSESSSSNSKKQKNIMSFFNKI